MENYPSITEQNWGKFFMHLYKNISDGFTFEKWYKIIHFSLPLNTKLYEMKRSDSPMCPKCGTKRETHPHLIYECEATSDVKNYIECIIMNAYHNVFFDLKLEHIIMGALPPIMDGTKLEILPTLLEIYFQSILNMRKSAAENNKDYSFTQELKNYKKLLYTKLKLYREISIHQKTFEKFKKKWNPLLDKHGNINIRFA